MTRLVLGFLCGVLAAGLRRPPGASLLELPAASSALGLRGQAAALAVAGLVALLARRSLDGRPNGTLLGGAALGVLAEGLRADLRPAGPSGMLALAPLALVLLLARERARPATPPPAVSRPGFAPALLLAGFGLALGLEPLVRVVRRFGNGTALEDALVAAVFLGLAAFGGLAFGAPLRSGRDRSGSRTALVAAVSTAPMLVLGWWALAGQAVIPRARGEFLARFGLDPSLEGQAHVIVLVALLGLLLPAFSVGLAVTSARRRSELAALCFGGALGVLARSLRPDLDPWSVGAGALVLAAVVGAIEPSLPLRDPGRLPVALAGGVAFVAFLQLRLLVPPVVLPWERFPAQPSEVAITREGQLLVVPRAAHVSQVLLDRTEIAPSPGRAAADAEQLRVALALVPDAVRERGVRVLLVGQLTPGRALVLAREGAAVVDRSAVWWRDMPTLERILFQGVPDALPERGRVRSVADARAALAAGEFDLVVAPSVTGGAPPRVPALAAPEGTVVVAWLDGAHDLAQRRLDGALVVASDGLDHPAVALTAGVELAAEPLAGRPARIAPGDPLAPPALLTVAFERPEERARRARTALWTRLAAANAATGWSELCAGLSKHHAAQTRSSPLAGRAERTELDQEALTHLLAAALRGRPDRLTRGVWTGLADVLVGKRDVEAIWEWVEPVAGAWADWPAGEVALAHADRESLDLDAAAARLAGLEVAPRDVADAARVRAARLALARALVDDGQAERGRELARTLLLADPTDREALELLEDG